MFPGNTAKRNKHITIILSNILKHEPMQTLQVRKRQQRGHPEVLIDSIAARPRLRRLCISVLSPRNELLKPLETRITKERFSHP